LALPALQAALAYMRPGDTLVVWKLDCLARSLKQLIETVEELGARSIGQLAALFDCPALRGRTMYLS
jgi:DNA invertase Pin-like site-specific DNA recombinase